MPSDVKSFYIKAIDMLETSYFYIKFSDFLNQSYMNLKNYHEKMNKDKPEYRAMPYINFQINSMVDIFEHLENDYFCFNFYLVKNHLKNIKILIIIKFQKRSLMKFTP